MSQPWLIRALSLPQAASVPTLNSVRKSTQVFWKEADLGKEIGCSNIGVAAQGQGLQLAEKAGAELIGFV